MIHCLRNSDRRKAFSKEDPKTCRKFCNVRTIWTIQMSRPNQGLELEESFPSSGGFGSAQSL